MDFDATEVIRLHTSDPTSTFKRATRADAMANRELILATAQRLFAKQGIDNVCMAAIAEAAGVGKGTLYRGFANKGELCLALMDEDMRLFQNKVLQMLRDRHDRPALARLDAFLDLLVHFMDFHAPLLREAQRQGILPNYEPINPDSPQLWLSWLHATIGLLLQQAQQNGETPELDIPYLVHAIPALLNADLFLYQRRILGFEVERISCGLRRLILEHCRLSITPARPGD